MFLTMILFVQKYPLFERSISKNFFCLSNSPFRIVHSIDSCNVTLEMPTCINRSFLDVTQEIHFFMLTKSHLSQQVIRIKFHFIAVMLGKHMFKN